MIAYDLQCTNGHRFEGWFQDAEAFECQMSDGLVSCPFCDGASVMKVPSTFAIRSGQRMPAEPAPCGGEETETRQRLAALGNAIRQHIESNFEDVGSEFAREALKIHYGVSDPRNIRGVSTPQEEKTLRDEGVQFLKFPASSSDPDS